MVMLSVWPLNLWTFYCYFIRFYKSFFKFDFRKWITGIFVFEWKKRTRTTGESVDLWMLGRRRRGVTFRQNKRSVQPTPYSSSCQLLGRSEVVRGRVETEWESTPTMHWCRKSINPFSCLSRVQVETQRGFSKNKVTITERRNLSRWKLVKIRIVQYKVHFQYLS